ncbi:TetR/AcrR family transcriptional regulator [Asticcacaulis sp. EMRT-3]|uniref:TetR/AcrR family transcriptional regulator n=1 Tax=Asticcacaulis sp. EMRT-3 TaxID=3040349 RepID=UPI0024AFD3ED|nr:TetR/AcrR family transcriptional regulator [Asticcacaulis sp. EMRT-3]MDI7775952.1 TetR/AcrR family transcriptional regulator [Asticcacaulis sp. EMRT-3]
MDDITAAPSNHLVPGLMEDMACAGQGADSGACATSRKRGRPRAYDYDDVLEKALEVFWTKGFSATSLDDLVEATGVNRPSLYAGFGDKEALYVKALNFYSKTISDQLDEVLTCQGAGDSILGIMQRYFDVMIKAYAGENDSCLGCAFICGAVNEAPQHESIMEMVQGALARFDQRFEAFFQAAKDQGIIAADQDPAVLSQMVVGLTANIGMRARAGASREELQKIIRASTAFLFR